MAWNNDNFIDFMKGIIPSSNAENEYDVNDIRGFLTTMLQGQNITFNEALEHMWKSFLDFIQQEGLNSNSLPNGALPITQNLFNKTENVTSLFEFINDKIDLNDTFFTNLLNNYGQNNINLSNSSGLNNNNYFWNESVSYLISYIMRNLTRTGIEYNNGLTISWNNNGKNYNTNIKNILQSNAFKDQVNYVYPINNISGVSYKNTRGEDLIQEDTKEENLQFTNEANVNNSLRLGMPEYERKVKVEDLNRNFWVISQCVAGISAYLFEDNSPISTAFNKILNELVQLWENLLYLWAIFAISIQNDKEYTDVHTEVVPLSISDLYNFRKYDNFDLYPNMVINPSELNSFKIKILQNIKYLEDMYPESNLCIIPFLRVGNYEHNYYTEEWYPGVALFNRNKEQNSQWDFKYFNPIYAPHILGYNGTKYGIRFKLNGNIPKFSSNGSSQGTVVIPDNIWTVTKAKAGEVKALYPYSKVNSYEEWDNDNYYAALRCIPFNFSASYINHEVVFGGGKISIIDAIGESIQKWASTIDSEDERYTQVQEFKQMDILYGEYVFGEDFNESGYPIGNEGINTTQTIRTINDIAPFGYYLGELISGIGTSLKKYPNFYVKSIYGRPLMNDVTDFGLSNEEMLGTNSKFNTLNRLDQEDLEAWVNRESASTIEGYDFYLFNLTHQFNIQKKNKNYLVKYWDYNNNVLSSYDVSGSENYLQGINPILEYNKNTEEFINKTLEDYDSNWDSETKKYRARSGNIFIYSTLWNPYTQNFYPIPRFLGYNRINLNPTDFPDPKLYHDSTLTNQIEISEYVKNFDFILISKQKTNGKYLEIENDADFDTGTYYLSSHHTSASLVLFDLSGKVKDSNWAVKYVNTSFNFNCICSSPETVYYRVDDVTKYGTRYLNFQPYDVPSESDYSEHSVTNKAEIIYQIIKNDVDFCYYEDKHLGQENYYENGYCKAPFYTLGWYDSTAMKREYNVLVYLIKTLYPNSTSIDDIIIPSSGQTGFNKIEGKIDSDFYGRGLREYLSDNSVSLGIQIISGYVTNISTAIIFPNQNYVVVRRSTQEPSGHNVKNRVKVGNFSSNFNVQELLPNFSYNSNKTFTENYNEFAQEWNMRNHVLYSIENFSSSLVTADGILEPIDNNKVSLNFEKYNCNGRYKLNGER